MFKYIAVTIFVLLIIGPILLLLNVASAPSRVINKTLGTNNIISSYEWYFDTNSAYTARIAQIQQFKGWIESESDPNEVRRLRVELGAMQQSCRELVSDYDANSEKLNKEFFKSKKLPINLDPMKCEI